jgi:hypothetical protein
MAAPRGRPRHSFTWVQTDPTMGSLAKQVSCRSELARLRPGESPGGNVRADQAERALIAGVGKPAGLGCWWCRPPRVRSTRMADPRLG